MPAGNSLDSESLIVVLGILPTGDAAWFALCLLGLAALVGLAEALRALGWMKPENTRRLVHAGTGVFVAATPLLFDRPGWLYVLTILFLFGNLLARRHSWLRSLHDVRPESLGTVTFPLAFLLALVICWDEGAARMVALSTAFLILGLADPAASLVGERSASSTRFDLGWGWKSVRGSATFAATAFLVTAGTLAVAAGYGVLHLSTADVLLLAVVVASVVTASEALASRGWDNFFVILAALAILITGLQHPESIRGMAGAGAVSFAFAWASYRLGALDPSGAVAAGLLAITVLVAGGIAWAIPALTFFLLSSILSRMRTAAKTKAETLAAKGGRRDAVQVYANGGVAWGCLLGLAFFPHPWWFAAFIGALAAAAADTWATEIGTLGRGMPRLITTGKQVPVGTSGAISIYGTLGGLLGALSIGVAAGVVTGDPVVGAVALLAGSGGMMSDSLAGATVQARYRDAFGQETERIEDADGRHERIRGVSWIDNDLVNLLSTATGAAIAVLIHLAL
jgi:uncharacterized protein (TIGR00297 family)